MPKDNIASKPTMGRCSQRKPESDVATKRLCYREQQTNTHIQHNRNRGRTSIRCGTKVIFPDGTDVLDKVACQFYGLLLAWMPTHYPDRPTAHDKLAGLTMETKYENTRRKKELLRQAGYTVETIWECYTWHVLNVSLSVAILEARYSATVRLLLRQKIICVFDFLS